MADLITSAEFATFAQTDAATIEGDSFAMDILSKASSLVAEEAGHPEWDATTVPFKAKLICLKLARRSYLNPDQELSTTTGPTASRVADEAALFLELSDAERATLASFGDDVAGLWKLSLGGDSAQLLETVFLPDDSQPGIGTELPWEIPYGDTNSTDAFTVDGDTFV